MAHSFTNLLTHIVFSTKHRKPLLTSDLTPRLFAYMGGIIRELNGTAFLINGPVDHVHILAKLPAKTAAADFLKELKSRSSGWVHDTFPAHRRFAWQIGYGAFGVSESLKGKLREYIANQEKHHRRVTFEQEFIQLLEKHGIPYDPRFVLD